MSRDTLKGQWMQLKGKVRQQWGKLTDDELDKMQGAPLLQVSPSLSRKREG